MDTGSWDTGDWDTGDALRQALDAGTLTPADYVRLAREAGVDTTVVAAAIKSAIFAMGAAAPKQLAAPPANAPATPDISLGVNAALDDVDAALEWIRAQPKWGMRAAERLSSGNDFLYDLDLYDTCEIDDEGARRIAVALKPHRTITSVNLSDNKISDRGVQHLCESLQTNSTVTSIDLGKNNIGADGATALINFISSDQCHLEALTVCNNLPGFTDEEKELLRQAWGSRDAARLQL